MPLIETNEMSGYEPPPPMKGNLPFKCVKSTVYQNGSVGIELECLDPKHPGEKLWEFIPTNIAAMKNEIQIRIAKQTLYEIGLAFDINPESFDTDDLVGVEFRALIGERKDKDGTKRTCIKHYYKLST